LFLLGAFCTLFSTLVVIGAASGRMWADLFGSLRLIDAAKPDAVRRCHQIVQTVWLGGLLGAFLLVDRPPAELIVAGHFVLGAVMMPLLMLSICWLAFHTDRRVRMGRWTAAGLIASIVVILGCVIVNVAVQITG
jgi:hypothetical protein